MDQNVNIFKNMHVPMKEILAVEMEIVINSKDVIALLDMKEIFVN